MDAVNALYYCDSTSAALIGDDDPGWVPADPDKLRCALSVAKNAIKLSYAASKCHGKMASSFFGEKDFDEEACEDNDPVRHHSALDKYNRVRDKLIASNICPSCLDQAGQDSIGAQAIAYAESSASQNYPCNLP